MKKVYLIIVPLLFVSLNVFSQSDNREIPLKHDGDNMTLENNEHNRRDIDILSLLPTVFYDVENENLIIESSYVTFENIPYYIADATNTVLHSGVLYLQKDVERTIPISMLCSGIYIIAIEIDSVIYSGEFEVE